MKKSIYVHLPNKSGVYLLQNKKGLPLYIGKATDLKKRVKSYFILGSHLYSKTKSLINQTKKIDYLLVDSELEALLLEAKLIKKYQPKYNVRLKDDKRYPSIAVTLKEKFPRVYYTRKREETRENKNILFFGPFPNPATVKKVLRVLRKIFPFRSCKKMPKKVCLYYHLGFCPGMCAKEVNPLDYKNSIQHLVKLFEGRKKAVMVALKKLMVRQAKKNNFQEAARIKKQIEAFEYITQPVRKLELLLELEPELYQKETVALKKLLALPRVERIEGYDVSELFGRFAVGSMVVFVAGESDKSAYRKFRIKTGEGVDDPGMIAEILQRRLKHPEWEYPDLIVVDGGKGQVSSAKRVLSSLKLKTPVIGLAKREEEIIFKKNGGWQIIKLDKSSPALHLIQRVRDEAHRFAQAYHKHLRMKGLIAP